MATDFKKRKINLLDNKSEIITPLAKTSPLPSSTTSTPPPILNKLTPPSGQKSRRQRRKKFSCLFIILIIFFTLAASILASSNDSFLGGVKNGYLFRQIGNIFSSSEKYLRGEQEDRINFVLLGMGGEGHDGPYLTDTVVILSFKPSTKEAAVFSLPRDMIVPLDPTDYRKLNSIYTLGQKDGKGGGELVKDALSQTLNMPIHYFGALDFEGFTKMIDAIGGVKIEVDKSFTDNSFPTIDHKWQSISFQAGEQKMNGLTALRFARSRHGNNGEGSDFARIKRQQKILLAVKNKITSFNTLINPWKITSLFSLFNQYTTTDLEPWEAVKLIHLAKDVNTQKIVTQSIDDRPGGYLKAGYSSDGAYILQPITGNYGQIQLLVQNIFTLSRASSENPKIVIQNGTALPGLALKAVNHLEQIGYDVLRYGNAKNQDKITTTIYQYNDHNPETAKTLEAIFETRPQTNVPPEYSESVVATNWDIKNANNQLEQLDFLIVIGLDQETPEGTLIIPTIDPLLLASSTSSSSDDIIER
jgi:LCP family protein required for cell wall assembly